MWKLFAFCSVEMMYFIVVEPDFGSLLWKTNWVEGGGELRAGSPERSYPPTELGA